MHDTPNDVYFDEAGNTGSNLLDAFQPTYILTSHDLSIEQCSYLLNILGSAAEELKFSKLKRNKTQQTNLISLLKDELINHDNIKVNVIHKKFMLIGLILDRLLEPVYRIFGIDLYKNGLNIGLTNILFHDSLLEDNEATFNQLLCTFLTMSKTKSQDDIAIFYKSVLTVKESFHSDLNDLFDNINFTRNYIDTLLSTIDKYSFDPAVTSLFVTTIKWGEKFSSRFNIIHDDSKEIQRKREIFDYLKNQKLEATSVGYDKRTFELPLKINEIHFRNSKDLIQLQLSDIIAGAYNHWTRGLIRKADQDDFFNELNQLDMDKLINNPGKVWPEMRFTSEELGIEYNGKEHPHDTILSFLKRSKDTFEKGD